GDDRDGERQREFAEHAADQAGHEQQRNEHRDPRQRQRDDRGADLARDAKSMSLKPSCLAPRRAAANGDSPSSMWRTMFSIITMASSTTKPVPMVSATSDGGCGARSQTHTTHSE